MIPNLDVHPDVHLDVQFIMVIVLGLSLTKGPCRLPHRVPDPRVASSLDLRNTVALHGVEQLLGACTMTTKFLDNKIQKNPRVRKISVRNSGAEVAAPILWTPGKMRPFCRKSHVHKIPRFRGGWGFGVLGGGGGSADFIFMGARIFLKNLHFQNFIVMAFPTKNSVFGRFSSLPPRPPPPQKRKFYFNCRLAVSELHLRVSVASVAPTKFMGAGLFSLNERNQGVADTPPGGSSISRSRADSRDRRKSASYSR